MKTKATRQLLLTVAAILTVLVSLAQVSPVLAEETVPPATEPAVAEATSDATMESAPAVEETEIPEVETPDAVSDEAPLPAEEPGPSEGAAEADPPGETGEVVAEIIAALDESDAVLLNSEGEAVPLVSEEAASALQGGDDPWFVLTDGTVVGYSASGVCAPVVTQCNTSSTPIQAAIDAAPAGSVITIDGTYGEQVTINKDLTLQGASTGGTLRLPSNTAPNPDTPNLSLSGTINSRPAYALVHVTNDAFVYFENLTIENRLLDGTIATNPLSSSGYLVGIWFDNGRGRVENSTIQEFTDNSGSNQTGVGIVIDDNSDGYEWVWYNSIYNNEVGVMVEGDNSIIDRNQFTNNTTAVLVNSGTGLTFYENNFRLGSSGDTSFDDHDSSDINAAANSWTNESGNLCSYTGAWFGSGSWSNFQSCANITGLSRDEIGGSSGDTQFLYSLDWDADGLTPLTAQKDNCLEVFNPDQADFDNDGAGDACDTDNDSDAVLDAVDNCLLLSNHDQANLDGDAMGDACDPDDDGDGVLDPADNCPLVSNLDQANTDGDAMGNACDPDDDGDGVLDPADNCPLVSNLDQKDTNFNGVGDACDTDDDGDGVLDTVDNCPLDSNADQANNDVDATGDACDPDDDNDAVPDGGDNCPLVSNADQANNDVDATGDACDPDDDNDAVPDGGDNCPLVSNADQANNDVDATGDACDPDDDNDAVPDGGDNCPMVSNPDQANTDGDALGNVCDPDDDNDGFLDAADSCPVTPNLGVDADTDGVDDACDPSVILAPVTPISTFTGTSYLIPVTGGTPSKIDCAKPTTIMRLANNDQALFTGLCGYEALLEATPKTTAEGLKALPSGMTFVSGMSVSLMKDNAMVNALPASGSLTVSFVVPDAYKGKKLTILYWDETAGDWVSQTTQAGSRAEARVASPGTFILVAE